MQAEEGVRIGERDVRFEVGRVAGQAQGAVLVHCGRSTVLVTVGASEEGRPGMDFVPLTVEFREKAAAYGRVPHGARRREGRASDRELLVSRLIDRSLRPLIPGSWRGEIQVVVTPLSVDPRGPEAAALGMLGAGLAMHLSPVPFDGPASALVISEIGGEEVFLPTTAARKGADFDLAFGANGRGVVMVEASGREQTQAKVLSALRRAEEALSPVLEAGERLRAAVGAEKWSAPASPELPAQLPDGIEGPQGDADKRERKARRTRALAALQREHGLDEAQAEALWKRASRARTLEGPRLDGRSPETVRPLHSEVRWLGMPHGSALFRRGETEVAASVTLSSLRDSALEDTALGAERRPFVLHYNFPPFSVGEARPMRGPGRREIGHGALATRALQCVLPDDATWPWFTRVEAEVLASNGSSSMATVCAASLALMDAGVPIKRPVAGIAMGLIEEDGQRVILTDILGDEDALGDMDFKVAGTSEGLTALQMDNKLGALGAETLAQALDAARSALDGILAHMGETLPEARAEISPNAPQSHQVRIPSNLVGALIGPKGTTVRGIAEQFGVEVDIKDSGQVTVFARDAEGAAGALARIREIAGVVEVDSVHDGVVTKVLDFGAFVKISGAAEGLIEIREWDTEFTEDLASEVKSGDEVRVKVLGVDRKGRIALSRRALL